MGKRQPVGPVFLGTRGVMAGGGRTPGTAVQGSLPLGQ